MSAGRVRKEELVEVGRRLNPCQCIFLSPIAIRTISYAIKYIPTALLAKRDAIVG